MQVGEKHGNLKVVVYGGLRWHHKQAQKDAKKKQKPPPKKRNKAAVSKFDMSAAFDKIHIATHHYAREDVDAQLPIERVHTVHCSVSSTAIKPSHA